MSLNVRFFKIMMEKVDVRQPVTTQKLLVIHVGVGSAFPGRTEIKYIYIRILHPHVKHSASKI